MMIPGNKYFCDFCGKEFKQEDTLYLVIIPVSDTQEDMCELCYTAIKERGNKNDRKRI